MAKAKKVQKKIAKKPVKKTAKKSAAKPVKKVSAKSSAKTAPKKTVKKVAKPVIKKAVKKAPAKKVVPTFAAIATPKLLTSFDKFMTPLDDRVVVQSESTERVTPGGLYIPDTVGDVSGNRHGSVVAVGRGRRDKKGKVHAMDVKKGDRIIFPQYAGDEIEFEKTKLIILREADVLGILS